MYAALIGDRRDLRRARSTSKPGEERHILTPEHGGLLAGTEREHRAEAARDLALPEGSGPLVPACKQSPASLAILETAATGQHQRQELSGPVRRIDRTNYRALVPISAADQVLVATPREIRSVLDRARSARGQDDLQIVLVFRQRYGQMPVAGPRQAQVAHRDRFPCADVVARTAQPLQPGAQQAERAGAERGHAKLAHCRTSSASKQPRSSRIRTTSSATSRQPSAVRWTRSTLSRSAPAQAVMRSTSTIEKSRRVDNSARPKLKRRTRSPSESSAPSQQCVCSPGITGERL